MKKTLALLLTLAMSVSVFAGCAGTAVVEKENTNTEVSTQVSTEAAEGTEVKGTEADGTSSSTSEARPVKTGLSVTVTGSGELASAEKEGNVQADVTIVAVTVDADGKINSCVIDQIQGKNTFNAKGEITTTETEFLSKNELGADYGMVAWGGAIAEWDAQAAALAEYVVGKTVEEVKGIAIVEGGKAGDADLAASATMAIAGFINPIVKAVENAQDLGAAHWDTLQLVSVTTPADNANATAEKEGIASVYTTVAAVTTHYDEITSCVIDAVSVNANIDTQGVITSNVWEMLFPTKNELGADYGMVAWGGAIAEWNEQAASFAKYVTGKTISEVAGIAVDEAGKTTEADLLSSVTIKIGDFKALMEKLEQ